METIKEITTNRKLFTVNKGTTIRDAIYFMAEKKVGLVPVLDEGKLAGVFSERDLVQRVIAKNKDLDKTKVEDVMTTQIITADINDSNETALAKMELANTRHIIILEGEKLIGVLSMRDLLKLDLTVYKTTIEVLNKYIYSK